MKMKARGRRVNPAKRCIRVKGKWKSVELDPSLFSVEGLEGLVCFEELTSYRLVDSERAAAREAKKKQKQRVKKRKAGDAQTEASGEGVGTPEKKAKKTEKSRDESAEVVADKDEAESEAVEENAASFGLDSEAKPAKKNKSSGESAETPEKKNKKKKKNVRKVKDETAEVEAEEVVEDKDEAESEAVEENAASSELESEAKPAKKNKKKKQSKNTRELKTEATTTEPKHEPTLEHESHEESERKPKKPVKEQLKNWTSAALSASTASVDVSAWKDLFVPAPVLKALGTLGFGAPTPIQALALPSAIRDRLDVLGAAETGSGKTLAFAIPMIHAILEWRENHGNGNTNGNTNGNATSHARTVRSLYLTDEDGGVEEEEEQDGERQEEEGDMDEEAEGGKDAPAQAEDVKEEEKEQEGGGEVQEEEEEVEDSDVDESGEDLNNGDEEGASDIKLGCVQTDKNVPLDPAPPAEDPAHQPLLGLVLTPTRELAVQVKHHIDAVAKFTTVRTALVVGGMSQHKQRRLLKRRPDIVVATPGRLWDLIREREPHLQSLRQLRCLVIDEADRMVERGHFAELESVLEMLHTTHFNPRRQMFIFSATLTLAHALPTRVLQKRKRPDKRSKLEILMDKVGIKSKPKVIDLSRKEATVETLTETHIHCQKEDKDYFLYYFLLQHPGRTMVFANSIDTIKRLKSILSILECTAFSLHANMQQKQRLRNLERFAAQESCVLLTTDVAARGLDIPDVQHVIHYQVPRTSEVYVHRSGRTARASRPGLCLLLTGPDDVLNFRNIFRTLGKDQELPTFPVETGGMAAIKERVDLAREIESVEYHNCKEKKHDSWFRQAAEALDVDLDQDLLLGGPRDEQVDVQQQRRVKAMKRHLQQLLSEPLFQSVMKSRYPTQMGKLTHTAAAQSALSTVLSHTRKQEVKKGRSPNRNRKNKKIKLK